MTDKRIIPPPAPCCEHEAEVAALRGKLAKSRRLRGYRVRIKGTTTTSYAYFDVDGGGGWSPTVRGENKPTPMSRRRALRLLRMCRKWAAEFDNGPFAWTYSLRPVYRRAVPR